MVLFRLICVILLFALKVFGVYFAAVAAFTLLPRRKYVPAPCRTRFAVLTAARNEEGVVAGFVRSVKGQNYPAELFDVFVVPNNCTDGTERAARAAGAGILRCHGRVAGKGDALHQAFAKLMDRGYDAFVVLDADSTLAPDYLARLNDAFAAGALVCKSRTRVSNPSASPVAGCYGLFNASMDLVWNRPRAALGLSVKLVGSGFAVKREVLEKLGGWNTSTIAEDAEFASQLAQAGIRVTWVPEAVNYDEAPTDFLVSLCQRNRWISGIMQVGKRRLGALCRAEGPAPWLRADMTMFLLLPFAQGIAALLSAVLLLTGGTAGLPAFLGGLALSYLGGVGAAAVLTLCGGYGFAGMLPAILFFPVFTASWTPLQVLSLFHDTRRWSPIVHRGAVPAAVK